MTIEEVKGLVSQISFRDWRFRVEPLSDGFFVQVEFEDIDHDTKKRVLLRGRKWYVSRFAIPDEIIKTCWVAVEMALKHEAMECFLVEGKAPFHPHNDSLAMLDLPKVHRTEEVGKTLPLTKREWEVAKLVAQGLCNRMIAQQLGIGEQSVKNLMARIMSKLNCKNRTQVALLLNAKEKVAA